MDKEGDQPVPAPPASTFTPSPENLLKLVLHPPARPGLVGNLGRYEVLKLIGSGGMGLVMLARDSEAGLPPRDSTEPPNPGNAGRDGADALVAIKIIKPELALEPRAVQRFLKEARHMRRFSHPNIVPILDISDQPPCPYFVMPYFARGSLATVTGRGCIRDPGVVLAIARQIASAVSHAHRNGIIHRDLKPSNVLLGADARALLADFGLARTLFNDSFVEVHPDHCEGTAPYLSPALAAGEAEDTRCDIYAFGAVLYEMLTGHPPYEGATPREILNRIRAGPPPLTLERAPDAPPELAAVADAAMARELRHRYARMSDVLQDLDSIANGQKPAIALGLSSALLKTNKSKRFVRRTLAAVAALIAAGGLLSSLRLFTGAPPAGPRLRMVLGIELPGVWRWSEAKVGRWQLDHEQILFLPHDDRLLIVSGNGQVMREWRAPDAGADAFSLDLLSDLNGDRLDDPVVSWRAGKTLHAAVLNHNLFPLKQFTTEGAVQQGATVASGTSGLTARQVADLNGDGRRELLATVGTGYELKPRGLYCFDYETGALLWSRETGPYLTEVQTLDLDGDGALEVVAGSHSVDNGNCADDGTDDRHGYLYAWTREGRNLWTRQLEGPFAEIHPLVARHPAGGLDELFVWVTGSHHFRRDQANPEVGVVLRLDAGGETAAAYDAGARLISCVTANLEGDGSGEILATDRHGVLHVLDRELKLRAKTSVTARRYDVVELRIAAVADLDADGHPEIILRSAQEEYVSGLNQGNPAGQPNVRLYHDNCIIVLSHDLKPVARYVVAQTWREDPGFSVRLADFDGTGSPRLVLLTDKAQVLEFVRPK